MTTKIDDTFQTAMNTAVRLLSQRDHTRQELQRKLAQRNIDKTAGQRVLVECERLNYIDDRRVACHYTQELLRKGFGNLRIRMDLQKKGVAVDIIDQTFCDCRMETREAAAAESALQKKRRRFDREPDHRKRQEKIFRFLQSRGFSKPTIWDAIRRLETI